jgi:hypothetical protein
MSLHGMCSARANPIHVRQTRSSPVRQEKERSLQATTEELMAEMEKKYINGVTQRQTSQEIRKLRLSAKATSRRPLQTT